MCLHAFTCASWRCVCLVRLRAGVGVRAWRAGACVCVSCVCVCAGVRVCGVGQERGCLSRGVEAPAGAGKVARLSRPRRRAPLHPPSRRRHRQLLRQGPPLTLAHTRAALDPRGCRRHMVTSFAKVAPPLPRSRPLCPSDPTATQMFDHPLGLLPPPPSWHPPPLLPQGAPTPTPGGRGGGGKGGGQGGEGKRGAVAVRWVGMCQCGSGRWVGGHGSAQAKG